MRYYIIVLMFLSLSCEPVEDDDQPFNFWGCMDEATANEHAAWDEAESDEEMNEACRQYYLDRKACNDQLEPGAGEQCIHQNLKIMRDCFLSHNEPTPTIDCQAIYDTNEECIYCPGIMSCGYVFYDPEILLGRRNDCDYRSSGSHNPTE
ncbi:MAG: hypothetical protein GY841_16640 [FCB group bacterium]|nr:hypothetical protein [FCB group bacterium]